MESIGLLAGGVAHDFNNMLCVILGNVELGVEVTNEADPVRPALSEIRMAAERSADLTNQLLAFARKQVALPQVLDLNHKISATLKMLRRVIGERIDVRWEPGSVVWPVRCDPAQVDQILTNLLLNARDAIEGVGQITVKVQNSMLGESVCSIHADVLPGPYVEVGVSDSGKGMDERTLAQVFQPFFTTKEMGRGTGLGLATVYGIVKQNDGHITVSSEPGKGSHFSVYLPRFTGDVIEPTVAVLRAVPKGRGEMILVVEDERRLLNLAEKMLKKLGYTPIVADLPSDALHKAKTYSGEIRLLVSDLMMPEMNGRELMQSIRNVIPGLRCVLTSGYPAQIVAQGDELDEGVYFMQKPYSMSDLSGAVHRALEGVSS
jgi:CheY-like chemotaxis protein